MKRAVLVTAGTAAGLVSVLAYSPPGSARALADVPAGSAVGLGAPPPAPAPADSPSPSPSAQPTKTTKPAKATVQATPTTSPAPPSTAAAKPTASTSPTPKPSPSKKPIPPSKPSPSPKPVSTTQDVTGSAVAYKYGTLQAAIRIKDGKIVDAWAVSYPKGDSLPYSEMAIPILRSQTIAAQSASIAGATGATLTSSAWSKSVSAALAKAGL